MAITMFVPPLQVVSAPAREALRFRVLRDGVVTAGRKMVRVTRNIETASQLDLGQESAAGEFTPWVSILQQVLVDQPDWLVVVEDKTPPAKVHAQTLVMAAGGTYTINVLTGSGSEATQPGTVDAVVKVSGEPADREILVVERKLDGDWRVAGNGVTGPDGSVTLDLDYVDGALYALGLDDFGTPFAPNLVVAVGRRIRPSVFAGVLYEVTEAGVLPSTEPAWWPITTEGSRDLGTARAVAVRYFAPIGRGPFPAELT